MLAVYIMFFLFFFFFLMLRRPPRSTLFPYTTLSDLAGLSRAKSNSLRVPINRAQSTAATAPEWIARSEEHTSELQSHSDLVCRLLLEKKKKKISTVA